MLTVLYDLLEIELIDFTIKKESYSTELEGKSFPECNPNLKDGHAFNQTYVELPTSCKSYFEGEVCYIKTFTRFQVISYDNCDFLGKIKTPEGCNILAQLQVLAYGHLMGLFRSSSIGTNFYLYCIQTPYLSQIQTAIQDGFAND